MREEYLSGILSENRLADMKAPGDGDLLSLYTCYDSDHQWKLVVSACLVNVAE